MARVSILLPVYNGARHLAAAIESVLAQTYSDWQLIVCDDQSTDASMDVVQRYARADQRIIVYRNEKNLGLFENYNECLEKSGAKVGQCEFVKPFAQDDVLNPVCLERLVKVLEMHQDVSLVSCARNWIGDDGTATGTVHPFPTDRKIPGADVIVYNLIQLTNWVGEPSTVLFRASKAGDGFDASLFHYGDIDYWFRILDDSQYYYLNESLCSFRRHAQSTTSKNLSGLYFAVDTLRLGKKYRSYWQELGESESLFFSRAIEIAALNVDHLARGEGLTAEGVISAKRPTAASSFQSDNVSAPAGSCADSSSASGTGRALSKELSRDSWPKAGETIDCSPGERISPTRELDREDAFRELSFYALRYVTELLYQHSALQHRTAAEKEHLERQLSDMKASTSWKITAPLRNLLRSGPE